MSFVVLDGPDGSGKSTQVKMLSELLKSKGHDVLCVREPGQTTLGENLREILLNADYSISALSEVFLFNAARSQMIDEVVRPALKEEKWVICDRFYPSTLVYQSLAGGIDFDAVNTVCQTAISDCRPDHVLMLDVPVDVTEQRIGPERDRMESKGREFLTSVRDGFVSLAEKFEWPLIDATQSVGDVHQSIKSHLSL